MVTNNDGKISSNSVEIFRDFLISQFPSIKKVKDSACVHRLKLGMELVAVCKKDGIQMFFVSNAKVETDELIKILDDAGISDMMINNKYSLKPFPGVRNPKYVRMEFLIPFDGRDLNSPEFQNEVKDIFSQFLAICLELDNIINDKLIANNNNENNDNDQDEDSQEFDTVEDEDEKYLYGAIINSKEIIKPIYKSLAPFYEGFAVAVKKYDGGFVNKHGNEITEFKYENWKNFSDGMAGVMIEGKWGFIDKKGNEVIPLIYDCVYNYSSEEGDDKELERERMYESVYFFSEGYALVKKDRLYGFIDKLGNEVTPFKYDKASFFKEGFAWINSDGKNGFINNKGEEVAWLDYEEVGSFSNGLAWGMKDNKYGFINQRFEEVTAFKYDEARDFKNGMAAVMIEGNWGFINKNGNEIIPLEYLSVEDFSDNLAQVETDVDYRFIDSNNNLIFVIDNCESFSRSFSDGLLRAENNGKWGYLNLLGNVAIDFQYEDAEDFLNGFAFVKLNDKWGQIDKNGDFILPFKYDVLNQSIDSDFVVFGIHKEFLPQNISIITNNNLGNKMKLFALKYEQLNSQSKLLTISPAGFNFDGNVTYRIEDGSNNQPFILTDKDKLLSVLNSPCMEINESYYANPCFDEVEDWINDLVPVEVEISDMPINESSFEINLYKINEKHKLFKKQSSCHSYAKGGNVFIQYRDENYDNEEDDNYYDEDPVREFFLSSEMAFFPIIIEHSDFNVYGRTLEFEDDTYTKVKKYLTVIEL